MAFLRNFRERLGTYGANNQESDSDEDAADDGREQIVDSALHALRDRKGGQASGSNSFAGGVKPSESICSKRSGQPSSPPSRNASVVPSRDGSLQAVPTRPSSKRKSQKKATLSNALSRLLGKKKETSSSEVAGSNFGAVPKDTLGEETEELQEEDWKRFVDKVAVQKATQMQELAQEFIATNPGTMKEELISFRDNILREAYTVICQGFLKTEYTRFTEVQARHKRMLAESRASQAAYLREITALRDQLRALPDGAGHFLDIQHFDPLSCLDADVRPLVEAAMQERMKQCLSVAHQQDSELSGIVCSYMNKEKESYLLRTEEAEAEAARLLKENERLQEESRVTDCIIDRERADAKEMKDVLEARKDEINSLNLENSALEAEVRRLQGLSESQEKSLKAAQERMAQQAEELQAAREEAQQAQARAAAPAGRQLAPLQAPEAGVEPRRLLEASPEPLDEAPCSSSALELLGELGLLKEQLPRSPETAVKLHKALERLSERMDSDCLEAAFRCKPRATAASIELLAHRVRTSRKEATLTRRCCISLAEALLQACSAAEADQLGNRHKELLMQSLSVASQNLGDLEDPKQRAIQAAAAVHANACEAGKRPSSVLGTEGGKALPNVGASLEVPARASTAGSCPKKPGRSSTQPLPVVASPSPQPPAGEENEEDTDSDEPLSPEGSLPWTQASARTGASSSNSNR
eukprot:TRINITY_DN2088_c0_g1_i1.p1 TRINITY_DN2088_c0_g1~~TRINITY_DN2088_c0_g1_i1.p1  ORF type:complete len:701 (-),score=180.11 TRINITY_DN2088_c0_g1_i1:286-2388(-)